MTSKSKVCAACAGPVSYGSSLCRTCFAKDPAIQERRTAGIRRAFADPLNRQRQRDAVTEANRRPERRAQSGELARKVRLWEHGLPRVDSDVRKRGGETWSARRMAHVPADYHGLYRELTKQRRLPADEALGVVLRQQEDDLARFRARVGAV